MEKKHRIYTMTFASVYPLYRAKVERKGQDTNLIDEIIIWLSGYNQKELDAIKESQITFEEFFDQAPHLNDNVDLIKGVICGVRIENIEDPLMKKIRYMDKLVDELANGKSLDKILRK